MPSVFSLCALILALGILRLKGTARLIVFLSGIIFFQERIVLFKFLSFHQFLVYTLVIAELLEPRALSKLRKFPAIAPLFATFLAISCIGLFDDRQGVISNVKIVCDNFTSTFFILYLFYANFTRDNDWKKIVGFFWTSSAILCLYGILCYITKANPYDALISNLYHSTSAFDQYSSNPAETRFRVNSFTSHPIFYGYFLGLMLLVTYHQGQAESRVSFLKAIGICLLIVNLFFTNSRTPIVTVITGFVIYAMLALKMKEKVRIALYAVVIGLVVLNIPVISHRLDAVIDLAQTGGANTSGSNLDMRMVQFDASYREFQRSPWRGNGFYYIVKNLGFSPEENSYGSDFAGFESYVYELLIEQGLAGILANLFFFGFLFWFFLKRVRNPLAVLGVAVLAMFLLFITATGTLGSWIITMAILGILMAAVETEKESAGEFKVLERPTLRPNKMILSLR